VALTFDDGPNPPYTDRILDTLRAHDAKATFFVAGEQAEAHADTARRVVEAGMEVGSHSYTHSHDLPEMSEESFARDLARAEQALSAVSAARPRLYRAPYGDTSEAMLRALRDRSYLSVGWDVDSMDWSDAIADDIVRNVIDGAHPGAIVLMHDGGLGGGNTDRSATAAALPRILEELRRDGYEPVTVGELLGAHGGDGAPEVRACSAS